MRLQHQISRIGWRAPRLLSAAPSGLPTPIQQDPGPRWGGREGRGAIAESRSASCGHPPVCAAVMGGARVKTGGLVRCHR